MVVATVLTQIHTHVNINIRTVCTLYTILPFHMAYNMLYNSWQIYPSGLFARRKDNLYVRLMQLMRLMRLISSLHFISLHKNDYCVHRRVHVNMMIKNYVQYVTCIMQAMVSTEISLVPMKCQNELRPFISCD